MNKVAEVTLYFWIMKILATTLGETAGDFISMSLGLGYYVWLCHYVLHSGHHPIFSNQSRPLPSNPLLDDP
jgi:hypothetical protein